LHEESAISTSRWYRATFPAPTTPILGSPMITTFEELVFS
jgi:hypothetical protein